MGLAKLRQLKRFELKQLRLRQQFFELRLSNQDDLQELLATNAQVGRHAQLFERFRAKILGRQPDELVMDFPTVVDGARGLAFIESAVESSRSDQKWYPMKAFQ